MDTGNDGERDLTRSIKPPSLIASEVETGQLGDIMPGWQVTRHVEASGTPRDAGPDRPSPGAPQYQLQRVVGRGGMGEVWEARQCSLNRVVAIKRILPRRWDEGDRRRLLCDFRHEAVISARLEHPGIVPVHDLGTDADGSPILAMKLVRGRPWNELIDEDWKALAPEEFLARHLPILVDVTQAVAFAHSQFVVHRDLKPNQVIVGSYGEVLLTDWGLGIFLGDPQASDAAGEAARLGVATPMTASNPAGTPAMMAPEQTELVASGIGTWTDVFLLGGILYILLTGKYPFSAETANEALERARATRFPPPSEAAGERHVPAELEDLCLSAMRREVGERVPSAEEFLRRLHAYISGTTRRAQALALEREAVALRTAGIASYAGYSEALGRVQRSLQLWPENRAAQELGRELRHEYSRLALANDDLVLARVQVDALEAGDPEAPGLRREIGERDRALRAAELQRRRLVVGVTALLLLVVLGSGVFTFFLQRSRDEARTARGLAERKAAEALAALKAAEANRVVSEAVSSVVLDDLGKTLDQRLPRDREIARSLGGEVYEVLKGVDSKDWPASSRVDLARTLAGVAGKFATLGELDKGLELLARAESLVGDAKRSGPANLAIARAGRDLYSIKGDYPRALAYADQSTSLSAELHGGASAEHVEATLLRAQVLGDLGRWDEAGRVVDAAIASRGESKQDDPVGYAVALRQAASLQLRMSRYDEMVRLDREAIELLERAGEQDTMLHGALMGNLGQAYRGLGNYGEAAALLGRSIALSEKMLGPDHPSLARSYGSLSRVYQGRGDFELALETAKKGLKISLDHGGEENPDVATARNNIGTILADLGRYTEARQQFEGAYSIRRRVLGEHHPVTLLARMNIAAVHAKVGEPVEAYRIQKELLGPMIAAYGANSSRMGSLYENLAQTLARLGQFDDAEGYFRKQLDVQEATLGTTHSLTLGGRMEFAVWLARLGRNAEADSQLARCEEAMREASDPVLPARLEASRSKVLRHQGCCEEAYLAARESLQRARTLPKAPESLVADAMHEVAFTASCLGRKEEARRALMEALDVAPSQAETTIGVGWDLKLGSLFADTPGK